MFLFVCFQFHLYVFFSKLSLVFYVMTLWDSHGTVMGSSFSWSSSLLCSPVVCKYILGQALI